jgi:ArsR family transcriptional regulator, arsenate/arsenite/antimonite-responsive transcriptional repressor / arsenate reductase (thioredoxin)
MTPAFNVLFLCTRNSAWPIMAEATLNRFADDKFRAYSVGLHSAVTPMPKCSKSCARSATTFPACTVILGSVHGSRCPKLDFVIGLCDTLDQVTCPDFWHQGRHSFLVDAGSGQVQWVGGLSRRAETLEMPQLKAGSGAGTPSGGQHGLGRSFISPRIPTPGESSRRR